MKAKLWDKGYQMDKTVEAFVVGQEYLLDARLVKYDAIASIAHAKMLAKIGILTQKEAKELIRALNEIIKLDEQGKFKISQEQEDVHTAIENFLTEELEDVGKKIHTGRSRNDQVLVALRLYYMDNLKELIRLAKLFIKNADAFSSKYGSIILPGYTHTRKAMPSSIKLWTGAFIESMEDNIKILEFSLVLIDQSPLGTGAGYGSPISLDREFTAKELGFVRVQNNPIYTQLSRGKFEATLLHAMCQVMLDLNKIATDLIIFSMPEFGYYELPQSFTTGSSMMPHKKNPDFLERLRASYHIVAAQEALIHNLAGNLPTGYNLDTSLTKEPIMKGFDITEQSLGIAALLFTKLKVNKESCKKAMTKELYATAMAYKLVESGVPFREAYKKVSAEFK